ncbi:DUF1998 domain-containing protein [Micrococcus luteus]|uniref:DUF1998 domain-containing protein n=1 Tax=Micrococcus luteus TaxID=1270 RepID=UPI0012DE974D|nr:DUF1998 domain-containing protein [Micrococcus luteus]QGS22471.1 DUF1998 domain-containing protein [Micrococcus luteus]QHG60544.1 DUF1998 domain-containing protein [Micrococcus luteus]
MTEKIRYEIRLPETVSPFGPGAIADVTGASLVAPDLSQWRTKAIQEIACERLVKRLGGGKLVSAPVVLGDVTTKTPYIPFWRFPNWRFCEECNKITRRTEIEKGWYVNRCTCKGHLVPMRFVAVCENGSHMQDIQWPAWTHRDLRDENTSMSETQRNCRSQDSLVLVRKAGSGEGLGSMEIRCKDCGWSRSMGSLGTATSLSNEGFKCRGLQPWMNSNDAVECDAKLLAKQRGATGNYLADIVSAIDIPPAENPELAKMDQISSHDLFARARTTYGSPRADMLIEMIAEDLDVNTGLVVKTIDAHDDVAERPLVDLKEGEWFAFNRKLNSRIDPEYSDFIVDGRTGTGQVTAMPELDWVLDGVGQVRRLREVRALHGYRRNSFDAARQTVDLGGHGRVNRFPAIEQFGEGIFLRFDRDRLADWEFREDVTARATTLQKRLQSNPLADQLDFPTARMIALHTFAHLLIRRLSFASGYSAAALRERIYSGDREHVDMAGVLIYTAAGDSQGTLGGLVRLGDEELLEQVILGALSDATWCSNDPVCRESDRHGATRMNLAACHGCCLVSETSCEHRNHFLDRQLLLGGDEVEEGLFSQVMQALAR